MLTHAPPPEPEAPPPPPAQDPAPPPARASRRAARAEAAQAAEAPPPGDASGVQESPQVRPLSQVRQQAGIEAPTEMLGPEALSGGLMPVEMDPSMAGLGPHQWEQPVDRPPLWQPIYKFFEDFSEWLFRGLQGTLGIFGLSLVPGVVLAIRGVLVLMICAGLVLAGRYVGTHYLSGLMGVREEPPVIPPSRTKAPTGPVDSTKDAQQAVLDFYTSIDSRAYSVAYDGLSASWRGELPFSQFETGYKNVESVRCTVKEARRLSDQKVELDIDLNVTEHGTSHTYTGTYVAVLTDLGWKLDSGKIK